MTRYPVYVDLVFRVELPDGMTTDEASQLIDKAVNCNTDLMMFPCGEVTDWVAGAGE